MSTPCTADPFANLRSVRAIVRSDLQITRQVHQDAPVYVVHDPVNFGSHRLPLQTYRLLTALNPKLTLAEVFERLVAAGEFEKDEEQVFYTAVGSLFQTGIIVLPFHDGSRLFANHQKISSMVKKSKLMGFLFLTVPLSHPDAFLTRTAPRLAWIFTKGFFTVWLVFALAALSVVMSRFSEFVEPINGLLATKNLVFLWISFIGLKIWHELGHGYACKVFGGTVPEMGTILIAGNPLAYVDATSAWSFPERTRRIIVMFGGMFFESLVAIPAVFIWAFSSNPAVSSMAYNLVFTATVITLLFNLNPLMKFDGYFIMSELLGLQNLRPRSDRHLKKNLKRVFLGLNTGEETARNTRESLIYIVYGISATLYRTTLVLSISMMVAQRFFLIGVGMAAFYILTSLFGTVRKLATYLLHHEETAPIRFRSRLVAAGVLVALPISLFFVPVPFGVVVDGIVGADNERYLHVDTPGVYASVDVDPGSQVSAGSQLVSLENPEMSSLLQQTEARLQEAWLRWELVRESDVVEAARQKAKISVLQHELDDVRETVDRLTVRAPQGGGRVVRTLPETSRGTYLQRGTQIAVVVHGESVIRTWLNEEQLRSVEAEDGSEVEFRLPGQSLETYAGQIVRIEPAAEAVLEDPAVTWVAGGDILVDPQTGRPMEPLFQVEIRPADELDLTQHGCRTSLRFRRTHESIAGWTFRRCVRFIQSLRVA